MGVFGIVGGMLGLAVVFAWVSKDLPDPNKLLTRKVEKTTKIWDRTGEHLLYEIHGSEKRTIIELNQVAPVAIQATISSEDRYFYQHKGFRLRSLVRAVAVAVFKGRSVQGTSTITQQLIKNAILTPERTLTRKVKELLLSYQIEKKFTKDEILKMYFNEIPYGSTAYGIESASQLYFAKSAADLDASEAALLAAMVRAPSRLSPYGTHKEELLWWQKFILDTMVEEKYLTKEQAEAAKSVDIMSRVKPRRDAIFAPHFSLYIKEQLAEKYGERQVEEGGLNVFTTLDFEKQKMAEEAVTNGLENIKKFGGSNAALVAMDPKTGQILSMVGSADYFDKEHGNVNVALRNRQPGSSFKPLVYAAAFEKGYTPDTVLFDSNTIFVTDNPDKPYEPKNYDGGEHGPVTLRKALAGSLNIPAVKTLYLTGMDRALDLAEKMGYSTFTDRSRFGLSLVLGGGEVKLIEHVAGYGVFASEGIYRAPVTILKVQDASGAMIEEWQPTEATPVLDPEAARNITDILSDNNARSYIFGEKNHLTLVDRMVAAKTGTTNGFHDAWTLGYTPNIVAGVWVGNNDNTAMKNKADGSKIAAPIWNEFMRRAHEGMPPEIFTKPLPIETGKPVLDGRAGEIKVKIDMFSGKLATESTPPSAIEVRTYRQAHDILHYVAKDDPRGPIPTDPASDPQYEWWEKGVKNWAVRNNWEETAPPPTETDDIHSSEQKPYVSIYQPSANEAIPARTFIIRTEASTARILKRVDFYIENVKVGTATSSPWEATVTAPITFGKGFYTIRAVAFDDIENNSISEKTVNFLFESQPLMFEWLRPSSNGTFRIRNFPFFIDTSVSDGPSVASVVITSATEGGEIVIGTVNKPTTNGVSLTWEVPPQPGNYIFRAIVKMVNGEEKTFQGPVIEIKQ